MNFDFYIEDFKQRLATLISEFRGRIAETDCIIEGNLELFSHQAGVAYNINTRTIRGIQSFDIDAHDLEKTVFGEGVRLNGRIETQDFLVGLNQPVDLHLTSGLEVIDLSNVEISSTDEDIAWVTSDGSFTLMPRKTGVVTLTFTRPEQSVSFTVRVVSFESEELEV